jgi:hypothetical protein
MTDITTVFAIQIGLIALLILLGGGLVLKAFQMRQYAEDIATHHFFLGVLSLVAGSGLAFIYALFAIGPNL